MINRRFIVNLVANALDFLLMVLVGIWLTPYLIRHVGVAAYGLIPLTKNVTPYINLFTLIVNSALGRFLTSALDRKDYDEANRIFNTSFWGSVAVLLVLLGPCLWLSFHADWLFAVPAGQERDAAWLLLAIVGMFYLTTLSSAFSVSSFCQNRLAVMNVVNILSTVVRVAVIVLLFTVSTPSVLHVGVALFISTGLTCLGAVRIWRKLTPMLELRISWFNLTTLRQLAGFGSWVVVDSIGTILSLSTDLLVVNRLIGAEATGHYAAVGTWSALLSSFAGVVAGVFAPTMILLYSRKDVAGLIDYARRAVRFVGLVMAIPIGLICGLSKPLLKLWLGEEFVPLAPLMTLMTCHLCINLAILPLLHILLAANKVRIPGIVSCLIGLLNLALAILLAGPVGWGLYGVAAAGAIALTSKNLIFAPIYAARILGLKWSTYFYAIIPVAGATLGLAALGWTVVSLFPVCSWLGLIIVSLILGVIVSAFIFVVLLEHTERFHVVSMLCPWMSPRFSGDRGLGVSPKPME